MTVAQRSGRASACTSASPSHAQCTRWSPHAPRGTSAATIRSGRRGKPTSMQATRSFAAVNLRARRA
eukprot:1240972-Pyramimonas_sp.AAC.1